MIATLAIGSMTLIGCGGSASSEGFFGSSRRDITSMSQSEIDRFVETLHAMKSVPSAFEPEVSAYDYFVIIHMEAFNVPMEGNLAPHMGPLFLPWHRELLRRFESELRRVSGDPLMSLPYWNWTDEDATTFIFRPEVLGGDGDPEMNYQVMDGPFRAELWPIRFRQETEHHGALFGARTMPRARRMSSETMGLMRWLGEDAESLPIPAHIEALLAIPDYDVAPWDTTADITQSMRNYLEGWWGDGTPGMHNLIHVWVGGDMAYSSSPNDPVFFLNHAFVDRLWALWQEHHGVWNFPEAILDEELPLFPGVKVRHAIAPPRYSN